MKKPLLFKNKYRIGSTRLQSWDYGANGAYFITICTKDRVHFFGKIIDGEMILNEIGKLAFGFWAEIPDHFSFIELGNFVVMPNHVHGILIIDKANVPTRPTPKGETARPKSPGQSRFRNQGKNTISSIVGSFKSVTTKNARRVRPDFNWQSRFHDHIIRDARSFENIQNYIENNPKKWDKDKFYD